MQFLDSSLGYALGGSPPNGIMKKTTNGGTDWFTVANIIPYNVDDIFFINKDTGWYCSGFAFDGGIYRTTNGGVSWQNQLNGVSGSCQLFFLNNDTGWATYGSSSSGSLYRTTNSGFNWSLQYSFPSGLGDVYFFNPNNGVVTSGRTYTTTDGGFNWTMSNSTATGLRLTFANDSIGWTGQNFSRIAKTTDGGKTWFYQNSPIFNNWGIFAIDSLKVWAGGSGIVHTTDGGPSSIEQIGTELPAEYELFQNYPNAFNPSTKISFSIKHKKSNVKLSVYNSAGEFISDLFNGSLSSGVYEIDFNASNLSSGIYYYTLITDNFKETKKMLLLK